MSRPLMDRLCAMPPGTSSGPKLRLKGRGVPASRSGGGVGDQYVKLKIVLPDKIDDELADFIQIWSESHPTVVRRTAGME